MSTKDATNLFNFLTKAGVKLVLDNGTVSTSVTSTRSLTTEEQAILDDNLSDVITILESQGEGDSLGSDSALKPGPSGTSSLRRGRDINNVETFNGLTGDVVGVGSFNGLTGGVTLNAGTNVTLTIGTAGVTIDTSDALGVSSFAGFTGAVAEGVTTNQVLFHSGTGISGTDDFLWDATSDTDHPHAEVDIEGKLLKAIKADEALAALDPVYITGNVGASDRVTVAKADASDPAKMPAAGIVTHSFATNDQGMMVIAGLIRGANTSGYSANDTAYVAVGGGITAARPSGTNDLIQNLGRVGRVHASTGTLLVLGAGRANDTPNLIHARAGISLDAGGITFSDGTHQSTAAKTPYVAGFLYDGRGSTVAAETKTNVIRPVEKDSTVTDLSIRLPDGASGGSVTGYIYKVGSGLIGVSGASLESEKTQVAHITVADGVFGATGGTLDSASLSSGDLLFGGVTGTGLPGALQLFIRYEG